MTSQERRQGSRVRRELEPDGLDPSLAPVRRAGGDQTGEALGRLVAHLDVEPGMRILEVTDGTVRVETARWEHVGVACVDTVPLCGPTLLPSATAPGLASQAASLRDDGRHDPALSNPALSNPALSNPARYEPASYDRVLVTVPVSVVSAGWVAATCAGGVLVVPWANPLAGPALARLVVDDERAAGPFVTLLDELQAPAPVETDFFALHASTLAAGAEFTCDLDPAEIWSDPNALFALGLRIPDVHYTEAEIPGGGGRFGRWVYDHESWAGVTVSATGSDPRWEHYGFSRLGGALESAYRWWLDNDRPGPDRFGMTVASFGQFGWLGDRYSGRIWRL